MSDAVRTEIRVVPGAGNILLARARAVLRRLKQLGGDSFEIMAETLQSLHAAKRMHPVVISARRPLR